MPAFFNNHDEIHTWIQQHTVPHLPSNDNPQCPICHEPNTADGKAALKIMGIAGCGHVFGATCLFTALQQMPGNTRCCYLSRTVSIEAPPPRPSISNAQRLRGRFDTLAAQGVMEERRLKNWHYRLTLAALIADEINKRYADRARAALG